MKKKNLRVTIRLTLKQRDLLDKLAVKKKCSLTELIIEALLNNYF